MFKRLVLAAVPALMIANSLMANDDLLSMVANLDGAKDQSAAVVSEDSLGQTDVDALLGEEKSDGEDAIAACFRRIGHGHGYGSYGCYSGYSSYCYPSYNYSYSCWSPTYYCAPTYTYSVPVTYTCYSPCYTSYWGCW